MLDDQTQAKRKEAADQFWEAVPPIWYSLYSQIDKTAREKFDITAGQFHVLQRIKNGKTSVSDLADARHISRPTVSRKIDNLVDKGLVSRKESREDRRFTILELTEGGENILQMMASSRQVWMEEQLGILDDQELEMVIQAFSILGKLHKRDS